MCNFMFLTNSEFCIHHSSTRQHSSIALKIPLWGHPLPDSPTPAIADMSSVLIVLPFGRMSNKWSHAIYKLLNLASFSYAIKTFQIHKNFYFFLSFIYLSNIYTQCGTQIQDSEIKSCMLFWLSKQGAPQFTKIINLVFYLPESSKQLVKNLWVIASISGACVGFFLWLSVSASFYFCCFVFLTAWFYFIVS